MEGNPNQDSYFDIPFTSSAAARSSYYTYYTTINGEQPKNPDRFTSGYWVREKVNTWSPIVYPNGLRGEGMIPEVIACERFVASGQGGYYKEGSYSYDKSHLQYLPVEGVGLLGG